MNVRLHTVRALVGAALVLYSVPSFSAEPKTTVQQTDGIKSDAASSNKPTLRIIHQTIPQPGLNKGDTMPPVEGTSTPAPYGGLIQRMMTVPKTVTTSSTGQKTTTKILNSTTRVTAKTTSVSSELSTDIAAVSYKAIALESSGSVTPVTDPTFTVKVIAKEVACAGGANIPVKLKYAVGTQEPVSLFNGQNLQNGMTSSFTMPLGTPEKLQFIATFESVGGCATSIRTSEDPNQAIIFSNGMDLYQLIAEKFVNLVYYGQLSLPNILMPLYADQNGIIQISGEKSLIAFEKEDRNQFPSAYDMNDLVIELTAPTQQVVDVTMHDSIGPDSSATDYMLGVPTQILPNHVTYAMPVSAFTATENGTLSQFKVVGYDYMSYAHPEAWHYYIHFYSSLEAIQASPLIGDIGNFYYPTIAREVFGASPAVAQDPFTYLLTFDLSSLQIPLVAGQTYYVGFSVESAIAVDGFFRGSTTTIPGLPTYIKTNAGIFPAVEGSGRLAFMVSQSVTAFGNGEVAGKVQQETGDLSK